MGAVAHINDYKKGHFFSNAGRGDMSWNGYENNVLLRNMGKDEDGVPRFADVAMAMGAGDIHDSRGIAVLDFDHDGDLDIAVNRNPGELYREEGVPPGLWRNNLGQDRHWAAISLEGTRVNRDAVGAMVEIRSGGSRQYALVSAGGSYASQHTHRLFFGLGTDQLMEQVKVTWPDGSEEVFADLPANHWIRIKQGQDLEIRLLPGQMQEEMRTPSGGGL